MTDRFNKLTKEEIEIIEWALVAYFNKTKKRSVIGYGEIETLASRLKAISELLKEVINSMQWRNKV